MANMTQNTNPYVSPDEASQTSSSGFWMIWILRNFAALAIVLSVSAIIMHVKWPSWAKYLGWDYDLIFVALCAGTTGLIASLIGDVNGTVWYPVWLLGIFVSHAIIDPPDPEWGIGICYHAYTAAPLLLIGFFTSLVKKKMRKRNS
jgi:hypothetical protein